MLRVKSFKITDGEAVNKLLDKYHLAKGASILVSNGHILVPYEDGEAPTAIQIINEEKEVRNELTGQMRTIAQSQDVNLQQIQELKEDIIVATEEVEKQTDKELKKKAQEVIKMSQERLSLLEITMRNNDKELARLQMNVDRIDQKIEHLRNS